MSKTGVKTAKQSKTAQKRTSGTGKSRRKVTFRIEAEEGSKVFVAGTFNGWDPKKHKLTPDEDGAYSTTLLLHRGTHEYKFIINDVWCVDPGCEDWTPNGMGSLNSVMSIL